MNKLLFFSVLLILFSCDSSDEPNCCTNIDINVAIKYLNSEGGNLISMGEYVESDIQIYHMVEGNWERYYDGNLDNPKGIMFDEREDGYYMTIFPSTTTNSEGLSETKIEFSESNFDVLQTQVDQTNGNEIVTKVWYNDDLKWEASENERMFEVVK